MSVRFATTLPYFSEPTLADGARFLPAAHQGDRIGEWAFELAATASIVAEAWRGSLLVLDSISKASLAACALIGLWPRRLRPRIILHGEMWNPDLGPRFAVQRAIVRLADRAIDRYIVLSKEELSSFPQTWGVSAAKMAFVPFFWTLKRAELEAPAPANGGYVFAGGNSHRDYVPLVEAARRFPNKTFIFATNRLANGVALPPNVTARAVSHDEFVSLLKGADAVVVPLAKGLRRSAGQQTYLNAMLLGKPVIVSRAFAVADHIEDGVTGLIVDASADDYERALRWLWDEQNEGCVNKMRAAAVDAVQTRFSFEEHARAVSKIIDATAEAADHAQALQAV